MNIDRTVLSWKHHLLSLIFSPNARRKARAAFWSSVVVIVTSANHAAEPKQSGSDYFDSGMQLEKAGDHAAAIDAFSHAIERDPHFSNAYLFRGLAFESKGDLDHAIEDLSTAASLSPKDAFMHVRLGRAHEAKGDLAAALQDYTETVQLEPNVLHLIERGSVRRDLGDVDGAMADYTRAIKLDPNDSFGYSSRADLEEDQDDAVAAGKDYEKAAELNPDKAQAHRVRAEFNFRFGKMAEALSDFEQARNLAKKPMLFHDIQIYLLSKRLGRPADTHQLALHADQFKNEWPEPVARFLLGECTENTLLDQAHQGDEATVRDHSCDAYYYIGCVRLLAGDKPGAREMFTRCRELNHKHSVEWQFAKVELTRLKP